MVGVTKQKSTSPNKNSANWAEFKYFWPNTLEIVIKISLGTLHELKSNWDLNKMLLTSLSLRWCHNDILMSFGKMWTSCSYQCCKIQYIVICNNLLNSCLPHVQRRQPNYNIYLQMINIQCNLQRLHFCKLHHMNLTWKLVPELLDTQSLSSPKCWLYGLSQDSSRHCPQAAEQGGP